MQKPNPKPTWARETIIDNVSNQPNKSVPPGRTETEGWVRREIPPRQWFNWILSKISEWVDYFEEKTDLHEEAISQLEQKNTRIFSGGSDNFIQALSAYDKTTFWTESINSTGAIDLDVDQNGFIYLMELGNTLKKLSPSGDLIWSFTDFGGSGRAVAVGSDGVVFGAAGLTGNFRKISGEGTELWSQSPFGSSVRALAVDRDDFVYGGSDDNTVRKFDSDGNEIWSFSADGTVYGVCVDYDKNVYIALGNNRVRKLDPDGQSIWLSSNFTDQVRGIAVDSKGFVYAASLDGTVKKFSQSGLDVWTFEGHTSGVNGLTIDRNDFIYSVGDDNTVRKIDPNGNQVWAQTQHSGSVKTVAVHPPTQNVFAKEI